MGADVLPLAPLPWQQPLWETLVLRSGRDRLPHALLFQGAPGVGKGHLARLLAGYLLCQQSSQGLPCGQCHACDMLAAGSHPDFFLAHCAYSRQGSADGDDAGDSATEPAAHTDGGARSKKPKVSRQIKMDCIRDLIEFSHHRAHQGGRRVVIIEPAEALNRNTANALLKTLEEPGDNLFIILVSHQSSRLLPTLRSRCQAVLCTTPPVADSQQWLAQFISPERAAFALAFCGAAPLRALRAVNEGDDTHYQQMLDILRASQAGSMTYLQAGEAMEKLDVSKVIDWWWLFLHQESRAQLRPAWMRFADTLLSARKKVHSTANPNLRLLLEGLLIDWVTLAR